MLETRLKLPDTSHNFAYADALCAYNASPDGLANHAHIYKRAVETALSFRRRREVGCTTIIKQASARSEYLI